MSELKEHIFSDIDEVFPRGYCGPLPSHEARPYYLKSEADKVLADKDAENRFIKERLDQQEKAFKWHKVENLFGKTIGDLPSRDLNRVYGRDYLVHYTVIIGGRISDGIAYSDYDDDEGFFELENGCTPVHWCEVPLPPLADKLKDRVREPNQGT